MLRNLSKFIQSISKTLDNECISMLMQYKSINRNWKTYIEHAVSRIKTNSLTYNVILECINYDKAIYDASWYKRKMLLASAEREYPQYITLQLPAVSIYDADLGDAIYQQYTISNMRFPDEYYILLYLMKVYPNTNIKLIPYQTLAQYLTTQSEWLEQIILHMLDDTELDNIVLFTPLCYTTIGETTYYICYANVIDSLIENDFPVDSDRFYIIACGADAPHANTTVLPDTASVGAIETLDTKLWDLSLKIKQHDETKFLPKNIASELSSFAKLFIQLTTLVEQL